MLVINEEHHSQLHRWIMETTAPCNLQIIESNSKRALRLATAAILGRPPAPGTQKKEKKKRLRLKACPSVRVVTRQAFPPPDFLGELNEQKEGPGTSARLSRSPRCMAFECLCSLYWCGAVTRRGSIRHAASQLMAQHHQWTWPSVGEF